MPGRTGIKAGFIHDDVVRVASEIADQDGIDAVTLARVAAAMDVRTPTISHHVATLARLRQEIAIRGVRQLVERISVAVTGHDRDDAVRAMYQAYRAYVADHPGRYAATIRPPDPRDPRRLAALRDLTDIQLAIFQSYGLSQADALRASRAFRAAVHGYVLLEMDRAWDLPLDDAFDWLIDALIAGVRMAPPAASSATVDTRLAELRQGLS